MWPFNRKPDPNNPCKWGHDYQSNRYTDEEGITWSETKCTKCEDITSKSGQKMIVNEYPIYMCTAPFGILFSKTSGSLSRSMRGMLTFNSGSINGSINTSLEETYLIKYLDGTRLRSKSMDAENAKVFIGGKDLVFKIETKEYYDKTGKVKYSDKPENQSDYHCSIHIPKLPDCEELTSTFLNVGNKEDSPQ